MLECGDAEVWSTSTGRLMKPHRPQHDSASESSGATGPAGELLTRTIEQLDARGIPDEALGVMKPAHRILGLMRPAVIVPAGRAWRLGVLLIDRNGQLYATGMVTRAITPKRGVADHSLIADARREEQRAAVRGSFAEGEVVNFGYSPIPLDAGQPAGRRRTAVDERRDGHGQVGYQRRRTRQRTARGLSRRADRSPRERLRPQPAVARSDRSA